MKLRHFAKVLALVVLIALLTLALTGCQALLAQNEEGITLQTFLTALLTGPFIGVVIAVILEKVPFAKRLFDMIQDLEWKRMAVLGMCVLLPIVSLALGWQLGYFEFNESTIFKALAAAWEAFTTSTLLHGFIRPKKPK